MKVERGNELAAALSYDLLIPLARDNLTLGLSVVLDSPAGYRAFQDKVDGLARDTKADLRVIECICTDETSLRQRLERREDMPDYRTRGLGRVSAGARPAGKGHGAAAGCRYG